MFISDRDTDGNKCIVFVIDVGGRGERKQRKYNLREQRKFSMVWETIKNFTLKSHFSLDKDFVLF